MRGLKNRLTKSKMAAAAILKILVNDHNSVAIAYIYIKFGSGRKTEVLETNTVTDVASRGFRVSTCPSVSVSFGYTLRPTLHRVVS